MFKNTPCFIRVIRSVSHCLSVTELGSDPTVRVLSDAETERLTGGVTTYPSAVVSAIGDDLRKWCTIGPSIWSSLSFLGRGTNVWRVRQYNISGDGPGQPFLQGDEMIMKTAWRSSARLPESDIYRSILLPPKGLATFECGDDVYLNGWPITVQNLRNQPVVYPSPYLEDDNMPTTPVLHRLVLRTIGRPMWQYTSDHDLLTGFRDALLAHQELWRQGILHRDISPGNVLLAGNQNESARGFVTDLDLARIESSTLSTVVETFVGPQKIQDNRGNLLSDYRTLPAIRKHTTFKTVDVKRGAVMTGTIQFMAQEIVLQVSENRPVTHEVKHDVESFIWVFSYCVMRRLYLLASQHTEPAVRAQRKHFRKIFFSGAFSQTSPDRIALARVWISPALRFPLNGTVASVIDTLMSRTLIDVFEALRRLVQTTQADGENELTHELLLEVVNKAIESLAQAAVP